MTKRQRKKFKKLGWHLYPDTYPVKHGWYFVKVERMNKKGFKNDCDRYDGEWHNSSWRVRAWKEKSS